MTATWSSTNKSSHAALSGANLVVAGDGSSSNPFTGRSDATISGSDKVYFEVESTLESGGTPGALGVAIVSWPMTDGTWGGGAGSIIMYGNGEIWSDTTHVTTIQSCAQGDVVCIAVDFANGKIWWRTNGGNWNNSGSANPATNTGGISVGLSGTLYPAYQVWGAASNAEYTANFGPTYAQTKPSGFTDVGGGSTPVTWDDANFSTFYGSRNVGFGVAFSTDKLTTKGLILSIDNMGVSGRSTVGITTGQKKYWEAFISAGAFGESGLGIVGTGVVPPFPVNSGSEKLLGQIGGVSYTQYGDIWASGAKQATFDGYADGVIVGIAVDFDAHLIWFRVGTGNWNANGSANPATGAGGFDYSSFATGDIYPGYSVYWDNDNATTGPSSATGIFDAGSFNHTPPSGFSAL